MKFEDLKKMEGAKAVELSDEQLEKTTGGFFVGAMEWYEKDGVTYRGCMGCGEALPMNHKGSCPLCGFDWSKMMG